MPACACPGMGCAAPEMLPSNARRSFLPPESSFSAALQTRAAAKCCFFGAARPREGTSGPSPVFEGERGFFKLVTRESAIDTDHFGGPEDDFSILPAMPDMPAKVARVGTIEEAPGGEKGELLLPKQTSATDIIAGIDEAIGSRERLRREVQPSGRQGRS